MPELPEVETMARELRPYVLGRQITGVWCDRPAILGPDSDAATLRASLVGERIVAVRRRAKIVLFDLSDGTLLTYAPRMTGQFIIATAGEPRGLHDRAGLELSDGSEIRIRDTRTFGRLNHYEAYVGANGKVVAGKFYDPHAKAPLFAALGPEPLDPDTTDLTMVRLLAPPFRHRVIKAVLLDQAFIAGIGNIYADEVLWASYVHPLRPADSLTVAEAQAMFRAIREILTVAVERRGSTIDSYRSVEGEGGMQGMLKAYGRAGLPCLRCGTTMERSVVAGRGTSHCPVCQPI